MNRIYQGRVTAVEIATEDEKHPWEKLTDWENALWNHHALFQDAVNYYLVALAALADPEHAVSRLTEDLRTRVANAWSAFPRTVGGEAIGLRQSVGRWIGLSDDAPIDDAYGAILGNASSTPQVRALALGLLMDRCGGEAAIQQGGRGYLPRFCVASAKPTYDFSKESVAAERGKARLSALLHGSPSDAELTKTANTMDLSWTVKIQPGKFFTKNESIERLKEALQHVADFLNSNDAPRINEVKEAFPDYEEQLTELGMRVESALGESAIPRNRKASKDLTFATLVFQYFPCPLSARVLALFVKKPNASASESTDSEVDYAACGDDPIKLARGEHGYVFRAFTALPRWNSTSPGEPVWKEFDIAAFKEALKSLNQFYQKTLEREATEDDLRGQLATMLGQPIKGWKPRKTESGEEEASPEPLDGELFRLARELERELTEELDDTVLGEEHEFHFGEAEYRHREGSWQVSSASLRGLRDISEEWMKVHSKADGAPDQATLEEVVKQFQKQEKNRKFVGSIPLFLHLCEKKYWPLWLAEEGSAEEGNTSGSFLASVAKFHLKFRDFQRSQEPINLTPAEPRHSRRLYMFSDLKDKLAKVTFGECESGFTVECALAKECDGEVKETRVRLLYSARRLLRDELQGGVESRWLQPMTRALGLSLPEDKSNEDFESAVSLMPDPAPRSGDIRYLLNFPVTLDPAWIHEGIGRVSIWKGQFNGTREKNLHLHWPDTIKGKGAESPWWENPEIIERGFTCVSVDLGQRTAGAWALLRITSQEPRTKRPVREIGSDSKRRWFAEVMNSGLLRLPGEDQKLLDRSVEPFGKAGRNALAHEWEEAKQLATALLAENPTAWVGETAFKKSLPEQNDALIALANRRLSRLNTFHRWSCFDPERPEVSLRRDSLIKKLTEELSHWQDPEVVQWKKLLETGDYAAFRTAAGQGFTALRGELQKHLVALANRVTPLRDRSWEWTPKKGKNSDGLYGELLDTGKRLSSILIRGQRGLSMARIEQLENLRRIFLRYNRSFDREPGQKVNFGRADFGRRSGEPCRLLLTKIDRMKEQRINQTAHLIVAEGLGVRLKAHALDRKERTIRDVHGEYEKIPGREPADFIVIENLDRYLTSQGRAPSENSRLMKWAHRAVRDKIKMLAEEPFGIPVVEAAAAYSSRFCAVTGVAGARCEERCQLDEFLRNTLQTRAEGKPKPGQPDPADLKTLLEQFAELAQLNQQLDQARAAGKIGGKSPFSLFLPKQGGPLFLPLTGKRPDQADCNAAINVGLRAVAAPSAIHILHKIRTEKDGDKYRPLLKNAREKAAFKAKPLVQLADGESGKLAKARNPNFFFDVGRAASIDQASIDVDTGNIPLASGIGLWAAVNQSFIAQLTRMNAQRLSRWRLKLIDLDDDVPM